VTLHLDLLALLYRIWGIFGVLAGASLGILAVGTEVSLNRLGSLGMAEHAAVWMLLLVALIFAGGGAFALVIGRRVRLRREGTRTPAFALAALNLLLLPFGTALGVYTFWVLMNDDARRAFGSPTHR
jgi:hypothetical protein